jgi:hypothetical protein
VRAIIEIAVTSGRGWGYDPSAFDRAFGGELPNPHRHTAACPEPYQATDDNVIGCLAVRYDWVTYP